MVPPLVAFIRSSWVFIRSDTAIIISVLITRVNLQNISYHSERDSEQTVKK